MRLGIARFNKSNHRPTQKQDTRGAWYTKWLEQTLKEQYQLIPNVLFSSGIRSKRKNSVPVYVKLHCQGQ